MPLGVSLGLLPVHSASASSSNLASDFPEPEAISPKTSSQLSLAQAVFARREEYTEPQALRLRVGTWNVASFKGVEKDLGGWFVGGHGISKSLSGLSFHDKSQRHHADDSDNKNGAETEKAGDQEARYTESDTTLPRNDHSALPAHEDVGLYALGLQEVVDINSAREALTPYTDPAVAAKFKDALEEAMPPGYELIAERQLIGLLLLVYASPSVVPHVRSVSTTSVGTGLMGYMGNKGAVTARILLGDTTRLVFVNSHMSAGTGKTESDRRNWDAAQIVSRTRFDPITDDCGVTHAAEKIGDEDFAFWFGDLNYRLDGIPGEDVRRILMLHTRNEYDVGQRSERTIEHELSEDTDTSRKRERSGTQTSHASTSATSAASYRQSMLSGTTLKDLDRAMDASDDPASLQTTLNSLLPHDELLQQRDQRKMFHDGWREGPITFLPTYKYDRGTVGVFDSGEKKRGPSWCDRILYRTRRDRLAYEEGLKTGADARKRDEDLKAQGVDQASDDEAMLFDYDPDADGDDDYDESQQGSGNNPVRHVVTSEGYEDTIQLEYYTSHQRVLSSDHKPLDASFIIKFDSVVPERKAKVQQEEARELDRAENEGRPVLTVVVDKNLHNESPEYDGVDFGKLRYDEPKVRYVTVANTGRVPAQFGFANRSDDVSTSSLHWLAVKVDRSSDNVKPAKHDDDWYAGILNSFTLQPGDTCSIHLTAEISDKDLTRGLNSGEKLEDVLVLRIKDGRDHFLPIRGIWQHSSHGRKLERLLHIPEGGLRKLQNQHPAGSWSRFGSSMDRSITDEVAVTTNPVPRQIGRLTQCVETLVERILAEWSMLGPDVHVQSKSPWVSVAGWPFVEESWTLDGETRRSLRVDVNESLDSDQVPDALLAPTLPPLHRLEVVAESLIIFLENLHDGIITEELWMDLEKAYFSKGKTRLKFTLEEQRVAVLDILATAPVHQASFLAVTAMLSRVAQEVATQLDIGTGGVSHELPNSPKVMVRRKALDADRGVAIRQLTQKNFAAVFADVLVRPGVEQGRSRIASQDDRRELVEMFSKSLVA